MLKNFVAEEDGITLLGTIILYIGIPVSFGCMFFLFVQFMHNNAVVDKQSMSVAVAAGKGGK